MPSNVEVTEARRRCVSKWGPADYVTPEQISGTADFCAMRRIASTFSKRAALPISVWALERGALHVEVAEAWSISKPAVRRPALTEILIVTRPRLEPVVAP